MFFTSLVYVVLLGLSAFGLFTIRREWLFYMLLVIATIVWGAWLFIWHFAVSHPPAIGLTFLMLIIALFKARAMKVSLGRFSIICLGCVLIAYTISILNYIPIYLEHQRALAKHPAIDLKPRLAYEQVSVRPAGINSLDKASEQAQDRAHSVQYDPHELARQAHTFRQSSFDHGIGASRRVWRQRAFEALSRVHEGFVADFIEQPALGWGRLPAMRPLRELDLPEDDTEIPSFSPPKLIEQPLTQLDPSNSASAEILDRDVGHNPNIATDKVEKSVPALEEPRLREEHRKNVANFVPEYSLGGVNTELQAHGFESHAFRQSPEDRDDYIKYHGWKLNRLDLVSLLKHQPPAVYLSEHLPAMDELRDAPTRPANTFEIDAIAKLRNGEELIVDTSGKGPRMVGAIRAITECRKCHQVPLGGLLGAFSYQFSDKPRQPHRAPEKNKPVASTTGET